MSDDIILLVGPSGSGKSTIENCLLRLGLRPVTSYTTRVPRVGEVNGIDYHFLSREAFETAWEAGYILERNEFNNNLYGLGRASFENAMDLGTPVAVIDVNGVVSVSKALPEHTLRVVWVDAPLLTLIKRMLKRPSGLTLGRIVEAVGSKLFWRFKLGRHGISYMQIDTKDRPAMDVAKHILTEIGICKPRKSS